MFSLHGVNKIFNNDALIVNIRQSQYPNYAFAPDLGEDPLGRSKREQFLHRHAELAPLVRVLLVGSGHAELQRKWFGAHSA
jgi:hypothetical protein